MPGRKKKKSSLYMKTMLTRKIVLPFKDLGSNLAEILKNQLIKNLEGKCIIEGFVRPRTINVLQHTAGRVTEHGCSFEVIFEASICKPVEGMKFQCIVKNVTKAGIRAERNTIPSPIIVFIARDHNYSNKYFSTIKPSDSIRVQVIGTRYELNDKYISILAELMEPKKKKKKSDKLQIT